MREQLAVYAARFGRRRIAAQGQGETWRQAFSREMESRVAREYQAEVTCLNVIEAGLVMSVITQWR